MRAGREWDEADRQLWWKAYYDWLEPILFHPGRWAIMPDSPAAPSQLNDGLLNDWPFGERGAPVWHMDGPIERLARLCERHPRVCLGWIGDPKRAPVGCEAYFRKMEEVAVLMGNSWHPLHMLRGTLVAHQYPFASVDSTSLAQNGHRYDVEGDSYAGRIRYAERLERGDFTRRLCRKMQRNRFAALRPPRAPRIGPAGYRDPVQLRLL